MPTADHGEELPDAVSPKPKIRHRLLLRLPHIDPDQPKEPLGDRVRRTFLKPESEDSKARATAPPPKPASKEELEREVKTADDKERLVGLIAAPIAAAIGLLVIDSLVSANPPAFTNGHANTAHVNPSIYSGLTLVVLVLSLGILVAALMRKRVILGVILALYGITIFNLHYWGFAIPFVIAAAWYLVRSYRINRDLKEASGLGPSSARPSAGQARNTDRQPNKRYTRPASQRRRSAPKPQQKRAG